jgi:hypothetical protein
VSLQRRNRSQFTRFPSFEDWYFWQKHYDDDNGEVLEEYRQIQEDDVECKYPGWAAMSVALKNMQSGRLSSHLDFSITIYTRRRSGTSIEVLKWRDMGAKI